MAQEPGFTIVTRGPTPAEIVGSDDFFAFFPADLCQEDRIDEDRFTYECALDARKDRFTFLEVEASRQLVLEDISISEDMDYDQSVDLLREYFP